jgi:hypothetical protein
MRYGLHAVTSSVIGFRIAWWSMLQNIGRETSRRFEFIAARIFVSSPMAVWTCARGARQVGAFKLRRSARALFGRRSGGAAHTGWRPHLLPACRGEKKTTKSFEPAGLLLSQGTRTYDPCVMSPKHTCAIAEPLARFTNRWNWCCYDLPPSSPFGIGEYSAFTVSKRTWKRSSVSSSTFGGFDAKCDATV